MPDPRPATRLLRTALRPERGPLAAVVALLVVAMLLPLASPLLLGRFVDEALAGRPTSALLGLAAAYLAVAVTGELFQLAVTWRAAELAWRAGNRLRERLADHALRLDLAWHGRHSPGELIERIDGDVEALTLFFSNVVLHVAGNAILLAGVLVVSTVIDWRAGAVLAVTTVAAASVMARLRLSAVPAHDAEREANARLYGDLEERLGGLEDLRANGAGGHAVQRLLVHSAAVWRAARAASLRGDGAHAAASATFAMGSVATLATGILLLQRGAISVGVVLALFRYSQMLRQPLERIAEQLTEFQRAMAGASRASRLLAEEPTIVDGPRPLGSLPAGALAVDLDDVALAYDGPAAGGAPAALRGIDLHLAPGTHLGVVGRTGSGKTSVGRLLLRLWDPTSGAVRLGGIDLRHLRLAELRDRVAVVTQDVELLTASVRDNLTLLGTRPADDERLRAVLDDVGLGPWLAALRAGLDTELGGAGAISAGEAQQLALARAFLVPDPALVILDEASSRLDPATESRIADATRRLLRGRTAVVIAHRLATLDDVDEIAVLDGGRLVEHGPRAVLGADGASRYARLVATSAARSLVGQPLVADER